MMEILGMMLPDAELVFCGGLLFGGVVAEVGMAYIWTRKPKAKIQVKDITYDKNKHRMEVRVRNNDNRVFYMNRTLLRWLNNKVMEKVGPDGKIQMLPGNKSEGRSTYDLLSEQESRIVIRPGEEKTLSYKMILPREFVDFHTETKINFSVEGEEVLLDAFSLEKGNKIRIVDSSMPLPGASLNGFRISPNPLLLDVLEALENSTPEEVAELRGFLKLFLEKGGEKNLAGRIAEVAGPAVFVRESVIKRVREKIEPSGSVLVRTD